MADVKYVKVSRLGSQVKEIALDDGQTVGEVITLAGFELGSSSVKVNGEIAELTDSLEDDDRVLIVPAVKGA